MPNVQVLAVGTGRAGVDGYLDGTGGAGGGVTYNASVSTAFGSYTVTLNGGFIGDISSFNGVSSGSSAGASGGAGAGCGVNAGNGGAGTSNSITGSSVVYGGGGGGGGADDLDVPCGGSAGSGGGRGGDGSNSISSNGTNGNTYGGGGGGGFFKREDTDEFSTNGGSGGAGVVIIRYLTTDYGTCTGGTITTSGSDTIHTFTSSGTFTAVAPSTATGNFFNFF